MLFSYLINTFGASLSDGWKIAIYAILAFLTMVIPYFLGGLNFAIILSRAIYHDDIRNYGSGNAGATNMQRIYGTKIAVLTMVLDMLKAILSVLIGYLLIGGTLFGFSQNLFIDGSYLAGMCCVIGHIFPCYYRFKGGKGVSSTAVFILCTNPIVFLILLACFLIIVIGTKYISMASVMCMLLYPLFLTAFGVQGFPVVIAILLMLLIIFMHRENLKRIYHGEESKFSFSKKKSETTENGNETKKDKKKKK